MDPRNPALLVPYFFFVISIFLVYGALVRRGTVAGKGILWWGAAFGLVAVIAVVLQNQRAGAPLPFVVLNGVMMAAAATFCVVFSYRQQRVVDLATFTLGDSKVIVRQCPPGKLPDADALLLPAVTTLRMLGGIIGPVGLAAGLEVEKAAAAQGPVGPEKVVETGPGKLAVGRIYHAAVNDPGKPADPGRLKRAMGHAALAARRAGAESVVVPVGFYGRLPASKMATAAAEGVLKQRRAFAEVVFVVLEARDAPQCLDAIRAVAEAEEPGATREKNSSSAPS